MKKIYSIKDQMKKRAQFELMDQPQEDRQDTSSIRKAFEDALYEMYTESRQRLEQATGTPPDPVFDRQWEDLYEK